jgi:hypothetical protein
MLLVHAAFGEPLLGPAGRSTGVFVQFPAPDGYVGNASTILFIRPPPGTPQPAPGDYAAALGVLATATRARMADFRSHPVSGWRCSR